MSAVREYLTYIPAAGDSDESLEMRYEEENIFTDLELDGDYCCRFR